jgi:hypothetical protein
MMLFLSSPESTGDDDPIAAGRPGTSDQLRGMTIAGKSDPKIATASDFSPRQRNAMSGRRFFQPLIDTVETMAIHGLGQAQSDQCGGGKRSSGGEITEHAGDRFVTDFTGRSLGREMNILNQGICLDDWKSAGRQRFEDRAIMPRPDGKGRRWPTSGQPPDEIIFIVERHKIGRGAD